jgi:hypothetical protein
LASTLDTICRIPALRHAPLKELTRLAAHLRQSTYTQGVTPPPSMLGSSCSRVNMLCCSAVSSIMYVAGHPVDRRRKTSSNTPMHQLWPHVKTDRSSWATTVLLAVTSCLGPFTTPDLLMAAIASVAVAGQPILRQGQEVADIHFVLQGSVQLTYSAALTHAAARAAARCSLAGSTQQGPSAAAAAAAARFSAGGAADAAAGAGGARGSSAGRFSGLALALRLEQTCFDPPVVLAAR